MRYGISAGAIVVENREILLVHHEFDDGENFWVPPGGSLEGAESILDCAVRETFEETNLQVDPVKIAYVEDFVGDEYRFCKFYILCNRMGGSISLKNLPEKHVTDARFMSRDAMKGLRVLPKIVSGQLWDDLANEFASTRYLGVTRL